jgi:hypothetical protein
MNSEGIQITVYKLMQKVHENRCEIYVYALNKSEKHNISCLLIYNLHYYQNTNILKQTCRPLHLQADVNDYFNMVSRQLPHSYPN